MSTFEIDGWGKVHNPITDRVRRIWGSNSPGQNGRWLNAVVKKYETAPTPVVGKKYAANLGRTVLHQESQPSSGDEEK